MTIKDSPEKVLITILAIIVEKCKNLTSNDRGIIKWCWIVQQINCRTIQRLLENCQQLAKKIDYTIFSKKNQDIKLHVQYKLNYVNMCAQHWQRMQMPLPALTPVTVGRSLQCVSSLHFL